MTQLEHMQQLINNYIKDLNFESYKHFVLYGISPDKSGGSLAKSLSDEDIARMKKVFDFMLERTKNDGGLFYEKKQIESSDWMHFSYKKNEPGQVSSSQYSCRLYLPIKEDSAHDYFMRECLDMLIGAGINFTGKVAKTYRNDSLMFEFESKDKAKIFTNLFSKRKDLQGMLGIHNPFIRDVQGMGFVDFSNFDATKTSYTSEVAEQLSAYCLGLDEQGKKNMATVGGFKEYLKQNKSKMGQKEGVIDQIVAEIEHCEILHEQEKNQVEPKSISDTFDEMKDIFESYELIERENRLFLKDRRSGNFVKDDEALVRRVVFANKWVEAAGVDLSLTTGTNALGVNDRQYEYAFNDGARQTFESMARGLSRMKENGQDFDLDQLEQYVKVDTGYKYSGSLVRGLLGNPKGPEAFLPQNENIPQKKDWEYSVIKGEIKRMQVSNRAYQEKTKDKDVVPTSEF